MGDQARNLESADVRRDRRLRRLECWLCHPALYKLPSQLHTQSDRPRLRLLGAGQKSGIYYALNPDTGAVLWQTQVGPGSSLGGMEWGSASDGNRIYVSIGNLYGIPYTAGSAGSWSALDPATGAILWQTPDPNMSVALGP